MNSPHCGHTRAHMLLSVALGVLSALRSLVDDPPSNRDAAPPTKRQALSVVYAIAWVTLLVQRFPDKRHHAFLFIGTHACGDAAVRRAASDMSFALVALLNGLIPVAFAFFLPRPGPFSVFMFLAGFLYMFNQCEDCPSWCAAAEGALVFLAALELEAAQPLIGTS